MITQFTDVLESNNFLSKDMNTFISEDDIYCNFDKFEHGKTHICFVTGVSGSGKSTLAKKLARKYNANYIELDIVMYALYKMHERAGGKDQARKRLREEHPWIYEWIMNTHQDEETWPKLTSEKMSTYDFHINKTMEIIDWLRQTKGWSTGKPPRFIIDGVDLVNIIPMRMEYTEYPFIFKGTSKIKAALRRAQREGGLKIYYSDVKGIIELIKAVYGEYYWSTTMQADQTAGRYKTINRDSSNAKEIDEDSLTAQKMGIIFDDDDINYNVNKFLNKEVPVLWLTGMSGGGKTTLANQICDKTDADLIGIDDVIHYMKFMLTGSAIDITKKDFDQATKMDKNYKLAHDYVKKHPGMNPYDYNHLAKIMEAIVKRYKLPNQIVIEGVQIPYICMRNEKLFSTNCAIIIKGTSILTSVIRRYKRDQDVGWFINEFSDIKRYFDMYRRWYKAQNEFRQFVTPNTESWADEKAIIDSMNDKDRDYASGSRSNMKYQYIYKEDGKPVGFVDLMEDINNNKNNVYMFIGINPKFRGKGIFTKLIDKACNWLNTHDAYKAIMYYINKDNSVSIQAISKIHTFKRQKDAYGKVVFKYDRVAATKEAYTSASIFPIEYIHPQETEYTCGPACARSLVHYYTGAISETESDIATVMGTSPMTGTTVQGMIQYFQNHLQWDVNSSLKEGSPSQYEDFVLFLDYNLSHGHMILVENKAFGGHWRIIVGFNEDTDTLTMVDPYNKGGTGITMVNARDFFTTWYDTNLGSYKAWVTATPKNDER